VAEAIEAEQHPAPGMRHLAITMRARAVADWGLLDPRVPNSAVLVPWPSPQPPTARPPRRTCPARVRGWDRDDQGRGR
jgi:hypothetical protein